MPKSLPVEAYKHDGTEIDIVDTQVNTIVGILSQVGSKKTSADKLEKLDKNIYP